MGDAKEDSKVKVVDVDQLYPFQTSGGTAAPAPAGSGDGTVTPTVENALRDVLGWRPRAQDASAFTAALSATFKLEDIEDHVVATYTPRGYAMAADLGAVTGGQASLYNRLLASRPQMLTLLDSLTPLIPAFDKENGEAYRTLVRNGISTLVTELGIAGGPRVPVVDAALRQLIGMRLRAAAADTRLDADDVRGQLGALRDKFGLHRKNVNNVEQEGIRTTFWSLTDLVLDINRAWVAFRAELVAGDQQGFLGTQLVLVNRQLSAVSEQLDDLESSLDSVYVSAAERETIRLPGASGLTVDGLLTWIRAFVTEDGPRIARDTGLDGLRSSFMPTVFGIGHATDDLAAAVGAAPVQPYPRPPHPGAKGIPPGMQAARVKTTVTGLAALIWQLTETSVNLTGIPVLLTIKGKFIPDPNRVRTARDNVATAKREVDDAARAGDAARKKRAEPNLRIAKSRLKTAQAGLDFLRIAIYGLNLRDTFYPVFQYPLGLYSAALSTEVMPADVQFVPGEVDSITADFPVAEYDHWSAAYRTRHPEIALPGHGAGAPKTWTVFARDLPIRLMEKAAGAAAEDQPVPDVQTRP